MDNMIPIIGKITINPILVMIDIIDIKGYITLLYNAINIITSINNPK